MLDHKADFRSGFVVFLIALPLSIGIALAAGAPASAGIVSAVLGGVLGSFCSGHPIAISGPAAGLIVVVLSSINSLGMGDQVLGFRRLLAATIVVGIIQVMFGLLRWGRFALLTPSPVLRGMLSAIGIIIVIKQIPIFLGAQHENAPVLKTLLEIPSYIYSLAPFTSAVGAVSLVTLLMFERIKRLQGFFIPSALISILFGSFTFAFLKMYFSAANMSQVKLLDIPTSVSGLVITPVYDQLFTIQSLSVVATLFLVCTIESLVSVQALSKLQDPKGKSNEKADLNKDLTGKGLVNTVCGFVGGYPVITEILRSSANLRNGGKSQWSNFYHGACLVFFVACFPVLLNKIPLTSLSAILIYIGLQLTNIKHILKLAKKSNEQLAAFSSTVLITLSSGLLMGILSGILISTIIGYFRGARLKDFFNMEVETKSLNDARTLVFKRPTTFWNYLALEKHLKGNDYDEVDFNGQYVDPSIEELVLEKI